MKIVTVVIPGLALLLGSQLLAADVPGGNQGLGQLDAIVNYCATVDPALQRAGQQRLTALLGKASAQELADARSTDEYRQAYDGMTEQLNGLDRQQSAAQCKALGAE